MKIHIVIILILCLTGCNQPNETIDNDSINIEILASYGDQSITVNDLSNHLKRLPAHSRWNGSQSRQWLSSQIETLILEKKLLEKANNINLSESAEFREKVIKLEREWYSSQYIKNAGVQVTISHEDIENFYNEHIDEFNLPEQRTVNHLFKSIKDDKNIAKTKAEIESVKLRVLNGENFMLLAEKYSDSESRHNKGLIGTLKKGELSQSFDDLVFSLEKNKVSEIVKTKDGFHLFLITDILVEKNYSLEAAESKIKKDLYINKSLSVIKELASEIPLPDNFKIISKEELYTSKELLHPEYVVLQVGNFSMKLVQLNVELNSIKSEKGILIEKDFPIQLLQEIAYKEVIYQHMLNSSITLTNQTSLNAQKDKLLIEHIMPIEMTNHVTQHPQLINDYFNENQKRFSSSVLLNLEILQLPKNKNLMLFLENAISKLNNKELTFSEIASELNGKVYRTGLLDINQLKQINTKIINHAFKLNKDEYSSPFTTANNYFILKLLDKKPAQNQSLAKVKDQVIDSYIKANSAALYEKIKTEHLNDVIINNANLDHFIQSSSQL